MNGSIEALWCEIIIDDEKKDKVIIGLCYDSPSNYEDKSNILYSCNILGKVFNYSTGITIVLVLRRTSLHRDTK